MIYYPNADTLSIQYDQAHDRNRRTHSGLADFQRIEQLQWGQVLHFLRFPWRDDPRRGTEDIEVAVVQPWSSACWLDNIAQEDFRDPPWRLTREVAQLQVMEVQALRHVAGRVPIDGSDRWVIFETTLGLLVPHMV